MYGTKHKHNNALWYDKHLYSDQMHKHWISLGISIITFDREVKEIVPLTELVSFQLPEITCPQSGPTWSSGLDFVIQK
jgi:uncharacterized protein YegL